MEGCDNCDEYLHMKGNRDVVQEVTSANFDGIIGLASAADSWVARWQNIGAIRTNNIFSVSTDYNAYFLPNSLKCTFPCRQTRAWRVRHVGKR